MSGTIPDYKVCRRALHIAAIIMQADGLCRYEAPGECRRVYLPEEKDCVKCIEKWLMSKARSELKIERKKP